MKTKPFFLIPLLLVAGIVWAVIGPSHVSGYTSIAKGAPAAKDGQTAKDVLTTKDNRTSDEAFDQMMDVLTHPRCINCHPNDNIPKQGDDSHPHYFGMARGEDDHGFQATQCATCHQSENNRYSGVPGAPHWALAPASMGWEGLSRTKIAERMLDPSSNGGKDYQELVEHLTEDELVLWAWNPGVDANGTPREKPPVSEVEFKAAVEQWFANGAVIPSE